MPRTEINPVHAVPPGTAEDALAYLREHKGMSYQHMDALLAYVERLTSDQAGLIVAAKELLTLWDSALPFDREGGPTLPAYDGFEYLRLTVDKAEKTKADGAES